MAFKAAGCRVVLVQTLEFQASLNVPSRKKWQMWPSCLTGYKCGAVWCNWHVFTIILWVLTKATVNIFVIGKNPDFMLRELAHTAVAAANSEDNLLLQACKWFKKFFQLQYILQISCAMCNFLTWNCLRSRRTRNYLQLVHLWLSYSTVSRMPFGDRSVVALSCGSL